MPWSISRAGACPNSEGTWTGAPVHFTQFSTPEILMEKTTNGPGEQEETVQMILRD
jgi:hypothetical protein